MTYAETLEYLYSRLPMFTRIGAAAYKKDLGNTLRLCEALGNPQHSFRSIHVAGTNGKGSVSHMLASILHEAGLKVGLYTSPHLLDFRERIRVNGAMMAEKAVVDFTQNLRPLIEEIEPSFFEATVAMAFDYFAKEKVDIAVVETGMGGRLDSTNVLSPVLSIITNVSYDHQQYLGETLPLIAGEKAGIIKPNTPVVLGEVNPETFPVFEAKAKEMQAPLISAPEKVSHLGTDTADTRLAIHRLELNGAEVLVQTPLLGDYQAENLQTVLAAIKVLREKGLVISPDHIKDGIRNVIANTGLMGRWQVLAQHPLIVADVAHNQAGLGAVMRQAGRLPKKHLHIVLGAMRDKDVAGVLPLLPKDALYHLSAPALPRAIPVDDLAGLFEKERFEFRTYASVADAFTGAQNNAEKEDMILVTGSFFVVAEVLAVRMKQNPIA